MLRHRHRARTTQLTRPASGVAAAALAALLVGSPAAHATPDPDAQTTGCGDSLENWTGQTLTGIQHWDNDPAYATADSTFAFPANNSHRANWTMYWPIYLRTRGTTDTDKYRPTGPGTIEFNSDLGFGKGEMWRFRLTAVKCNPADKVVAATANTYIPPWTSPFIEPVTHYGTAKGKPLQARP
jgi:hypothetical protein